MNTLQIQNLVLRKKNSSKHSKEDEVTLIHGLSAIFESGKLNAIMGANGSSKTTFLQFLYGNCEQTTKTSGSILYNGVDRTPENWYSRISIAEQEGEAAESRFATKIKTTVREYLQFLLDLKNVHCGTSDNLEQYSELIEQLHLTKVIDNDMAVVSGGEKKRAVIAGELLSGKEILIMDEPTSDLDSHLALQMMIYLKRLAVEKNLMIIFTIHQPSDQLIKNVDNLLFIHTGGRVVYSGPLVHLVPFLAGHGIVKPDDWSISDFLFEAFYNESSFKAIRDLKPKIDTFLLEIQKVSNEITTNAHLTNKSFKNISWKVNIAEISTLYKRYAKASLLSLSYAMRIVFGIGYSLFVFFIFTFTSNRFLSNDTASLCIDESEKKRHDLIKFSEEFAPMNLAMLCALQLAYILMNSNALSPLNEICSNISKNRFSPFSVMIAAFLIEVTSCILIGALMTVGIYCIRPHKVSAQLLNFLKPILLSLLVAPPIFMLSVLQHSTSMSAYLYIPLKILISMLSSPNAVKLVVYFSGQFLLAASPKFSILLKALEFIMNFIGMFVALPSLGLRYFDERLFSSLTKRLEALGTDSTFTLDEIPGWLKFRITEPNILLWKISIFVWAVVSLSLAICVPILAFVYRYSPRIALKP